MAYDKIIDSAQLDSAMSATANAIRAKTGGADKIMWDALTGFANVIADIPSGESNYAQGRFAVSGENVSDGFTVTGLGFKPRIVFVYTEEWLGRLSEAENQLFLVFSYNITQSVGTHDLYGAINDTEGYELLHPKYITSITMLDDGFSIGVKSSYDEDTDTALWRPYVYSYIAIR